jgi:hypothetical protein
MLITLVHSPACHFCDDAQAALAALAEEFGDARKPDRRHSPVTVELVAAASPAGRRLVSAHRAAMYPLVLLDGEFFSCGRLPRGKLRRELARREVEKP